VTSIDVNPLCASNFPDSEKWRFVLGDSQLQETFDKVCNYQYDVLYVDGGHEYHQTLHDIRRYSKLVRMGGLILVHDVLATDNFPGVWRAFSEFRWYTTGGRVSCKYVLPGSFGLGVIEL
jgi:methyltransferase family protein